MGKITLAHSELTNTIYAIIGREKIDITEQAIAEVKAVKALEQEPCDVNSEVIDGVIEWLKDKDIIKTNYQEERAREELIDYLEQEHCGDCISREAVLDFIADMSFEVTADGRIMIKRRTLEEYISDMPSVQPQPKTGKWVYGDHRCPCCGEDKFKDLDADIWADWFPKYCPNCGAKMESEVQK